MISVLREYISTITDMDTYFEKDKTDKFYLSFIKYMKNGFYIPIFYYGLLWLTQNLFLSTIITLKLYPANHYYWFADAYSYRNIPKQFTFMKQFVRMTDTGHLVSFLYLVDKSYLPLAHNVHFFITVGYWTGKAIGSMDQDIVLEKPDSGIIRWYETGWSSLNHGLPYILFLREMFISNKCYSFDYNTLWLSYQWNYIWLVFVYIPWRLYTGDIIYSILDIKSGYEKPLKFFIFLHLVTLFANITGYIFSFGLFYVSFMRDFQKIDHFDGF